MLIRVLTIAPSSGNFHFSGGEPQAFVEVDWFRDDDNPLDGTFKRRNEMTEFIKAKRYFREGTPYLVLHPVHPFTIGYHAP